MMFVENDTIQMVQKDILKIMIKSGTIQVLRHQRGAQWLPYIVDL